MWANVPSLKTCEASVAELVFYFAINRWQQCGLSWTNNFIHADVEKGYIIIKFK